jgi:hypothetical protein
MPEAHIRFMVALLQLQLSQTPSVTPAITRGQNRERPSPLSMQSPPPVLSPESSRSCACVSSFREICRASGPACQRWIVGSRAGCPTIHRIDLGETGIIRQFSRASLPADRSLQSNGTPLSVLRKAETSRPFVGVLCDYLRRRIKAANPARLAVSSSAAEGSGTRVKWEAVQVSLGCHPPNWIWASA